MRIYWLGPRFTESEVDPLVCNWAVHEESLMSGLTRNWRVNIAGGAKQWRARLSSREEQGEEEG